MQGLAVAPPPPLLPHAEAFNIRVGGKLFEISGQSLCSDGMWSSS